MGTPEFARVILAALHATNDYDIVAVVAQPDKAVGRSGKLTPPPVAEFAQTHALTLLQPAKIRVPQVLAEIQDFKPDVIVVAAYGKILPDEVLKAARVDIINVHASLLPKYRGASPISEAIINGDNETGVAIMRVVEALDAGPIYAEARIPISDDDDTATLTTKLSKLGAETLCKILPLILSGKISPQEQNHAQATHVGKLTKELSPIDWTTPARNIFNKVRALVPWPVAETTLDAQRIQIYKCRDIAGSTRGRAGEVLHLGQEGWTIATGSGQLLVTEVQVPGKKRMRAFDAANGLRLKTGMILR